MMGGKVRSSNEPHGSVVYVHRSTPAFRHPGTLFSAASLVGEQGRGRTHTFVQVYVLFEGVLIRLCFVASVHFHSYSSIEIKQGGLDEK